MMAGRLAGRRILVVEDEYFIASDMKRALAAEGAVVVGPVAQLDKELALADHESLDAAILDVNLGGTTTYPLADRLQSLRKPLVFVTGYDEWSMPAAHRDTPRIAKPFTLDAIVEMVAGIIDKENAA